MICRVSLSSPTTANQYDPADTSPPRRRGPSALLRALWQMPKLSSELPLTETRPRGLLLLSHPGKPQVVISNRAQRCPSSPPGCPFALQDPQCPPARAGSASAPGGFSRVGRLRDRGKRWGSSPHAQDKTEALLCLNPIRGIWGWGVGGGQKELAMLLWKYKRHPPVGRYQRGVLAPTAPEVLSVPLTFRWPFLLCKNPIFGHKIIWVY